MCVFTCTLQAGVPNVWIYAICMKAVRVCCGTRRLAHQRLGVWQQKKCCSYRFIPPWAEFQPAPNHFLHSANSTTIHPLCPKQLSLSRHLYFRQSVVKCFTMMSLSCTLPHMLIDSAFFVFNLSPIYQLFYSSSVTHSPLLPPPPDTCLYLSAWPNGFTV